MELVATIVTEMITFISKEGVMSFVFQSLAIVNLTVRIPNFD